MIFQNSPVLSMQLCKYCFDYRQRLEEESERVAVEERKLLMKCVMCWDCG